MSISQIPKNHQAISIGLSESLFRSIHRAEKHVHHAALERLKNLARILQEYSKARDINDTCYTLINEESIDDYGSILSIKEALETFLSDDEPSCSILELEKLFDKPKHKKISIPCHQHRKTGNPVCQSDFTRNA